MRTLKTIERMAERNAHARVITPKTPVMKLNKEWHLAHPMPKNPTEEERIKWHIEHAKHCQCREMTPKLKAEIRKWKNKI